MHLVDTNFLGTLTTQYPVDIFPSFWDALANSPLFSEQVFFHQEVEDEMKRWNHPQYHWYSARRLENQILLPDEAEIECHREVAEWVTNKRLPRYKPAAVDEFLDVADSWLIASAYRHGATIVTNETSAPQSVKQVKIPDVAEHFSVECVTALDFIRYLGISV